MTLFNIIKGQLGGRSYIGPCGKTHYFANLFFFEFPFSKLNSYCFPLEFHTEFPVGGGSPSVGVGAGGGRGEERLGHQPRLSVTPRPGLPRCAWPRRAQLAPFARIRPTPHRFVPHRVEPPCAGPRRAAPHHTAPRYPFAPLLRPAPLALHR